MRQGRFKIQATNTSTTTNCANVASDSVTYNMVSATLAIDSNSKMSLLSLL